MNIFEMIFKSASLVPQSLPCNNTGGFIFHSYIKDPNGRYINCNEIQVNSFGFSKLSDVVGLRDYDLLPAVEADALDTNDKKVFATGKPHVFIEHITCNDSRFMTATSFKSLLMSTAQNIIGVIGFSFLHVEAVVQKETNLFNLSKRQMDCLFCLAKGYTVKEISNKLNLSPRTIEHYLESIKLKLNCTRRSEIVSKAFLIPEIRLRLLGEIAPFAKESLL